MSDRSAVSHELQTTPYWWQRHTPEPQKDDKPPLQTDVLVIGSGFTGLHAAIETAAAGMKTVVVDAGQAGWGCSTRNGGQVSTCIKPGFAKLKKQYGTRVAEQIFQEGQMSLDFIADFVKRNGIDCDYKITGRFHGAHTPRQYEILARECDAVHPVLQTGAYPVPRSEQRKELGTAFYHGGVVFPNHASIDPGRYHAGLVTLARQNGATLVPYCAATNIAESNGGYDVRTEKGVIRAKKVVVATNGYSGKLMPWLRRRIIPIGSYIIATEEVPQHLIDQLFPTNRILSDTRKLVYYYRLSPDRKRVLFGGRVSLSETDPRKSAPILHRDLVRIFPELSVVGVSHSWAGTVGYTFDSLMHAGCDGGVYWAGGYCGSGVGMASYLGNRLGRRVAGHPSARTIFEEIPFRGRPYYWGNPWFLLPSILYFRFMDSMP
ncbi:MAG: FAD-binding oxidoreductase [Pseudomonadota bacterium]